MDVIPYEEQSAANAWAGRMIGVGNVAGYFIGYLDLPKMFPYLGSTQLRVLCAFAVIILGTTVFITCASVKEEPPSHDPRIHDGNWYEPFIVIKDKWVTLPKPISLICNTQFFSWMGWFPFLFYSSSWASKLGDSGNSDVREGSFALLLFAIVSVAAGFVVPFVQGVLAVPLARIWAYSLWGFTAIILSSLFVPWDNYPIFVVASLGICWGKS